MLGAWWDYPLGPLASSHASFVALLLLFRYLCLLLASLFDFLMSAKAHFSVGLGLWAAVFSFTFLSCSGSFCLSYPKVRFLFKVLEPILSFSCVAAATLLTPRHYHWACF